MNKESSEKVECSYGVELKGQDGFACLEDNSLINCFGRVIKLKEDVESSSRLKVRKAKIDYLCTVLHKELSFSNIPDGKFMGSSYVDPRTNAFVSAEEVKTTIEGDLYSDYISKEEAIGKMVVFYKWPNPIKDKHQLNSFDGSFLEQLGEMVLNNKLEIGDFIRNSIEEELKVSV